MNYNVGDTFYEGEDYAQIAKYCDDKSFVIEEVKSDTELRKFIIKEVAKPTEKEFAQQEIYQLKQQLEKYKEDVEQVELFGMQRADYNEKKKLCAEIVVRLRELEKLVKSAQLKGE